VKLYYSPGACSLSPHIVALEAGIPMQLEKVDLASHKTARGEDFYKTNGKGYVPTLELDDGSILTEGPAVVQYLADQRPASGLVPPAGTIARYRLQEWLTFIGTEMHKMFSVLFNKAQPEDAKEIAKDRIARRFAFLDQHLAGGGYLLGQQFTAADAYCFTIVSWSKHFGMDLATWPNLKAYIDRVAARPKVQEALRAEGLAA
jgi:glutathione S-transferase